jgi:Family of unknown function (DUF6529)
MPVTAFVLTAVTIGLIAARHTGSYPAPPFIRLFFSDTIHLKAWLATGAGVPALFQIVSAARVFELFHWAAKSPSLKALASTPVGNGISAAVAKSLRRLGRGPTGRFGRLGEVVRQVTSAGDRLELLLSLHAR